MGDDAAKDDKGGNDDAPKKKGCCGGSSKVAPEKVYPTNPVTQKRKITDLYCFILFLMFWAVEAFVVGVALNFGNGKRMLYAKDYNGDLCGGKLFPDRKYTYFPRLNEDMLEAAMNLASSGKSPADMSFEDIKFFGVCMTFCPAAGDVVCTYGTGPNTEEQSIEDYSIPMGDSKCSTTTECKATNPKFPSKSDVELCGTSMVFRAMNPKICKSCWLVAAGTMDIMYRCIYKYTKVKSAMCERCLEPPSRCPRESLLCQMQPNNTECVGDGEGGDSDYIPADSEKCVFKKAVESEAKTEMAQKNPLIEALNGFVAYINRAVMDVMTSAHVIGAMGVGGALTLGFAFVLIMLFFAPQIVWGIVFAMLLFLITLTALCYYQGGIFGSLVSMLESKMNMTLPFSMDDLTAMAGNASASLMSKSPVTPGAATEMLPEGATGAASDAMSPENEKYWQYAAYGMSGATIVYIIIIIVMCKSIRQAIAIIQEGSKALLVMPTMVLWPLHTVFFISILGVFWVYVASYLYTIEELTLAGLLEYSNKVASSIPGADGLLGNLFCVANSTGNCSLPFSAAGDGETKVGEYLLWYHLFMLFWTGEWIRGIGIMVIAGAVSDWYWSMTLKEFNLFDDLEEGLNSDAAMAKAVEDAEKAAPAAGGGGGEEGGGGDDDGGEDGEVEPEEEEEPDAGGGEGKKKKKKKKKKGGKKKKGKKKKKKKSKPLKVQIAACKIKCKAFTGKIVRILCAPCLCLNKVFCKQGSCCRNCFNRFCPTFPLKDQKPFPVLRAIVRTHVYHLGSVCVGSFMIAVCWMLITIAVYVDRETKKLQDKPGMGWLKKLMKVIIVLTVILKKIVEYFSTNAYIMVAMTGCGFLKGGLEAVALLIKNIGTVAFLKIFVAVIMVLGKVLITGIICVLTWVWLQYDVTIAPPVISSKIFPTVVSTLLAFMIATGFLAIYELAINTVLLCFCQDMAQNKGTFDFPYRASDNLLRVSGKKNAPGAGLAPDAKGDAKKAQKEADNKAAVAGASGGGGDDDSVDVNDDDI